MRKPVTLVRRLLGEGLVDGIEPLDASAVGGGKRLFQEGLAPTPLEVVRSRTSGPGGHHVIHAPRGA
ncbi:hypothetical protein ACFYRC_06585 [Streptomyces sp. NPDC005279]|uniref:hypothetical protein n=1 Tax=Streptomyces sp. NPDC005279 TaxID=3364712 RepID=UPI00368B553C